MSEPNTDPQDLEVQSRMANQAFFEKISSDDPTLFKQANDTVNSFTRWKMREDGIFRRILPPLPLSNDELTPQVDTDKPVKVCEMEPDNPGSVLVPFGTNPIGEPIRGRRYRVMFARLQSPEFYKDIAELRTYEMDIRQVISDNALKDMLAEEDTKFIHAIDNILGSANSQVAATGTVQYRTTTAGITRDALVESLKVMGSTPNSLNPTTMLINNVSVMDILKFHRDEAGGDISQDMLLNGYTQEKILGRRVIVTIKKTLVPTDTVYYFAEPKFLGKFFTLEDTTMFMEKRAYWIRFFAYSEIGAAIANVAGVTRQDFNVNASS